MSGFLNDGSTDPCLLFISLIIIAPLNGSLDIKVAALFSFSRVRLLLTLVSVFYLLNFIFFLSFLITAYFESSVCCRPVDFSRWKV